MANLRLLCVLVVLAAVCWEANCHLKDYGKAHLQKCGSFKVHLSCGSKSVMSVSDFRYGKRKRFIFWLKPHWYGYHHCAAHTEEYARKLCHGKQKCVLDSRHIPRYHGDCDSKHNCLQFWYSCYPESSFKFGG